MFQIASMSKKSLNLNRRTGSFFSGCTRARLSRTHKLSSRGRAATLPLSLRLPYFPGQTGRKRYFCETLFLSLENKVPSIAPSNHDIDSQSPTTQSTTLLSGTNDFSHHHRHPDVALDKFTHFALNSHTIPLGSMHEENWLDVLDAIDGWLNVGGGFAADSAERLLERLMNEQAASFSKKKSTLASSYSRRAMIISDLQRDVLNAWIELFHQSEGNSQLAISRAEQALFRLLDLLAMVDKPTIQSHFPIEEYITVVEGYLHPHRHDEQELKKAGKLLLRLASNDNEKWDVRIEDYGALISPIYETCVTQLLTIGSTSTLVTQLLKTMTVLKESGICPEMNIPDAIERMTPNTISQRAKSPAKARTSNAMSPFEVEVAENRLVDVLKNATEDEKNTIHGLVQKLTTTKLKNDVIIALLEYYIKIGDSESASHWLQKLEISFLVSSYDLVERVLESWLAQKGSNIPWRADEVFKAITRKIQEHDEKIVISTKSFELIAGIWTVSEDPSASRKIIDWYSQMTSWMVTPNAATLKITVRALSRVDIDNPLNLVSNDLLQQWDSFTKNDKAEIANAVLEVISLKQESLKMILTLIDRFRDDNVIPAKSLFQSSLSAVQIDAAPSDVLAIVYSFDNTTEGIDLSLYSSAIDTLFKLNEDARTEIQSLYDNVMRRIITNRDTYDPNEVSEFLYSVTAMQIHRKLYSEAESCLEKAEDLFLSKVDVNKIHSPIPLKCYKKIIVRNWYTAKTAQKVEESFEKLMELYRGGYSNLQPDCDLYTAYIDARAIGKKNVEQNLEEMMEEYKSSENEAMKPQAKVFNTVLLSLAHDKRNSPILYKKSINLLNRMFDLGVQPDIKTFNLVLKNALKGNNKNVYERSTMLIKMIQESKLNPDTHTLHLITDACGSAPSDDRDVALKRCLSTFGEIRKQNFVGPITYGILSKVIYRLTSRDVRADKVGESLLSMCCDDGMLTSEVRGRLQSMMSRSAWEKQYVSRLSNDEREPADWSRNIQTN
jgi:hypothetical protein